MSLTASVTQTPAGLRGLMAPAGLGFGLSGGCWHGCQAAPPSDCWHQGCWEGRRMAASRLRSSSASGSLCLSGSSRLSRDNLKVHRLLKLRESSFICEEQSTCKHGLGQLGGGLLIRQLASSVAPGSRGAELVSPGARGSKLTTQDLADTFNTGDLKFILIKDIVKLKMVLGIDQGRCQGGESISYRGSVGEKLSKSHQAEDRHCAHKTWIRKMDLNEENCSLMRSTLYG